MPNELHSGAPTARHTPDPDAARAADEALRRHVAFLEEVAGDPAVPRAERLRALELLAQIAGPGHAGAHAAGKSAAKHAAKHAANHAAKHAAKHAGKHAAKHASKHAAKTASKRAGADRQLTGGDGGPRGLAGPGAVRRLPTGGGPRALPSGQ